MDFINELKDFKNDFDKEIADYFQTQIFEASKVNSIAGEIMQNLEHLILAGGKRFRPALVYYTYLACGGKDHKIAKKLGLSLEIFHTFALIHDDIIDLSLTRRGVPTLEKVYQEKFASTMQPSDIKHQAMSAAILGGDYAHTLADKIIQEMELESSLKEIIGKLYYQMQFELVAGQIDDCFGVGLTEIGDLTEEKVKKMLISKSGNYSVQKPILLGASLSGMQNGRLQTLGRAGERLGLVFQIKDDILGIFGSPKETGKPAGIDIVEGKKTLLMLRTFEKATTEEKTTLNSILGNSRTGVAEIEWVKDTIKKYKILDNFEAFCFEQVEQAKKEIIEVFDQNLESVSFLLSLADFLYARSK
jgi:geranylgeranyl diphosphate synthase type I